MCSFDISTYFVHLTEDSPYQTSTSGHHHNFMAIERNKCVVWVVQYAAQRRRQIVLNRLIRLTIGNNLPTGIGLLMEMTFWLLHCQDRCSIDSRWEEKQRTNRGRIFWWKLYFGYHIAKTAVLLISGEKWKRERQLDGVAETISISRD